MITEAEQLRGIFTAVDAAARSGDVVDVGTGAVFWAGQDDPGLDPDGWIVTLDLEGDEPLGPAWTVLALDGTETAVEFVVSTIRLEAFGRLDPAAPSLAQFPSGIARRVRAELVRAGVVEAWARLGMGLLSQAGVAYRTDRFGEIAVRVASWTMRVARRRDTEGTQGWIETAQASGLLAPAGVAVETDTRDP